MKTVFTILAFVVASIALIVALRNKDHQIPQPPAGPEYEIKHVIVSQLQSGNQPIYFLRMDTVENINDPIPLPEAPLRIRSSVYSGDIVIKK